MIALTSSSIWRAVASEYGLSKTGPSLDRPERLKLTYPMRSLMP